MERHRIPIIFARDHQHTGALSLTPSLPAASRVQRADAYHDIRAELDSAAVELSVPQGQPPTQPGHQTLIRPAPLQASSPRLVIPLSRTLSPDLNPTLLDPIRVCRQPKRSCFQAFWGSFCSLGYPASRRPLLAACAPLS